MTMECLATDRQAYAQELAGFLPARIFDAHVHLFDRSCLSSGAPFSPKNCYGKFGGVFTQEQYLAWTQAMMPQQEFHLNSFGHPGCESSLDASAGYSGGISDNRRFFGMALISPRDSSEAVLRRIEANKLIGFKPYHSFVDGKKTGDITLQDMLPAEHMRIADEKGLAVTLHIPRPGRLADPVNQAQMVALCRRYPGARIIFAHIGRAYFLSNAIGFLDGIAACDNAYIDTAMVNHEGVLEHALQAFPRDRVLFGSDAPIACLRGKSVEINNQYAYLMGEDYEIGTSIYDASHTVVFTSFFFEQLRGIKQAATRVGLSKLEVENLFFHNASRLFQAVAKRNYGT